MSEENFSVRPATEDDLAAILDIERRCYPAPCVPWTADAFRGEIQKQFSHFLVLTDDETDSVIAGYIVYWLLFDECHILNVAIHPDWRGQAFGTRLIRNAINDAVKKEVKRVFLEVRKSNAGAVALYQKLGFFVDHIKSAFYENGEDCYFMILYLDQPNKF
ncbi:MAG: ribosomal protein S18-alanine N-acetyltransferase [Deltaproteobacteria bacterium]|nr:ribosomal protein S18-alanine N-acetyltransferase [Deltaproteobacteria bacterium]